MGLGNMLQRKRRALGAYGRETKEGGPAQTCTGERAQLGPCLKGFDLEVSGGS